MTDLHTVGSWMNKATESVTISMPIKYALQVLHRSGKTELPVTEKGHYIGTLRERDCIKLLMDGRSPNEAIAGAVDTAHQAVHRDFSMEAIRELPVYVVTENTNELLGEIHTAQLLAYQRFVREELHQTKEKVKWYELGFDTAYEGLTVVDEYGVIQLFNENYSRFVGVSKEEAIGKKAADVIDNTRLPVVLKTGVPERSQAHRLQGQDLVVHRLPIWKNNRIVGAIGVLVYEGVSEIYQVIERMQKLEEKHMPTDENGKPSVAVKSSQVRFEEILGDSPAISKAKKIARKAAKSKATVLITGESGVGKEQFARAIHDAGLTGKHPFISVNCAAIPENLLESELFGYAKGAFTGANKEGKAGKFELAHRGTIFLDEIGDMPLAMQAKILRVLQEKQVERVGGNALIPVDFRLIAATNKDLKQLVDRGEFREDLYYRLFVVPLDIPPLRVRKQDIPIIIASKMHQLSKIYGMKEKTIDQEILRMMRRYDWPGNIRELINVLERLLVLTDGNHIATRDLPDFLQDKETEDSFISSDTHLQKYEDVRDVALQEERRAIESTLERVKGNKTKAAQLLGISRATLYNKLSRYAIET
ncbi:sigma 54-interacting transcriptional regulator [Virgibacillus halophilus]|uniref:sigma 54-interacting transcriptional regulator n=1 Tax=Tigheibacillus halophilus TaxID=361280 RepID=UPI0036342628